MYYVILMIVSVSGIETTQIYNNEPSQERFVPNNPVDSVNLNSHQDGFVHNGRNERPFVNPSLERNHRNSQDNGNYHSQNGFVNSNNPERFNVQNNGEFIPNNNNRNDRSWNPRPNQDQIQVNLNSHEPINAQRNREFIPKDRLTSDRSRDSNLGLSHPIFNNQEHYNAHNNREFDPNESNNRNDRNWNPHTNQGRPHAFNNEQYSEQKNRELIPNNNDRRNDGNLNVYTNQGHSHPNFKDEQFNEQTNRELIPNDNINEQNNRGFIPNSRDANAYQGRSHNTGMSINLAFDGQGNQHRRENSNLNIPRQTFNINNEYSNRDTNRSTNHRSDKYNENISQPGRHEDKTTLEDYNRETQTKYRSNLPGNQNNNGIVSFLNNLNNTNQNINQSGFKQTNTVNKPKTAIENEVTPNPLQNGNAERDNRTVDNEWVWGVEDTTTMAPVTVDDRAAFSGDKCSTGMVRFRGKCVTED